MATEEPIPPSADRLVQFVGHWQVDGSLSDGADEFAVAGTWRFSPIADGWGVRGDLTTVIQESGSFAECELIGVDAVSGQVHMFSINKFTIRDHIGAWSDERTLVTVYESQSDEGNASEEITITFLTPNRMTGLVVEKLDERVVLTTKLELTRTPRS